MLTQLCTAWVLRSYCHRSTCARLLRPFEDLPGQPRDHPAQFESLRRPKRRIAADARVQSAQAVPRVSESATERQDLKK